MLVLTSLLLIYIRQSILLTRASYELLCKAIPEPIAHLLREGQTVRYAVRSAVVVFGDIEGTMWTAICKTDSASSTMSVCSTSIFVFAGKLQVDACLTRAVCRTVRVHRMVQEAPFSRSNRCAGLDISGA